MIRGGIMDIVTVKQRQQAAWASGDYAAVGARFPIIAELLCESVDLRAGERVLDVACGSGNAALAAALHQGDRAAACGAAVVGRAPHP
jgi:2-polyprenyl-3-methyl-5-hydroxy-6-metoxy-1,4-benzoquinol methylase